MKDNFELPSEVDDRNGLRRKSSSRSWEHKSSKVLDNKEDSKRDIGEQAFSRLVDALDLGGKLDRTDSIDPSVLRDIALEKLEKVQNKHKENIEELGNKMGNKHHLFVDENFDEGSFAFKLNDSAVQFAKDLKQLAVYLDEKKDFKISEGELDRQLQKGNAVESNGKKIKIELIGASDAERQLQDEVDFLERRIDALAGAYWPHTFKDKRVYAYKDLNSYGKGIVLYSIFAEPGDAERGHVEPATLHDALIALEKNKTEIENLHKRLRGIEVISDEIYAHTFKEKLYITGNSELKAEDLENFKTQGLSIPQTHIDALKNADTLEEGDKPKRVDMNIAHEELKGSFEDIKASIKLNFKEITGMEIISDEIYAHTFKKKLYITGNSELKAEDLENFKIQGLSIPQTHVDTLKDNRATGKRIGLEQAEKELKNYKEKCEIEIDEIEKRISNSNKSIIDQLKGKSNALSEKYKIMKMWKKKQIDRIKELEQRHSGKKFSGDDLYSYEVRLKDSVHDNHYSSLGEATTKFNELTDKAQSVKLLALDQIVECLEKQYKESEKKYNTNEIKKWATRLGRKDISVDGSIEEWEGVAFKLDDGKIQLAKNQDGIKEYLRKQFESVLKKASKQEKENFNNQMNNIANNSSIDFKGKRVKIEMLELVVARKEIEKETKGYINRIKVLQRKVFNEHPDKDEDVRGYLVNDLNFYTLQHAQKELAGQDDNTLDAVKQLKMGQSHEVKNGHEVKYKVERIGLERIEYELEEYQKKARKYIAQALKRSEADYRYYSVSGRVHQADGTYREYNTIKLCERPEDLESHINNKYFKLKDTELNTLNTIEIGKKVQYQGEDQKNSLTITEIDVRTAREILEGRQKKKISEIAEIQKKLGNRDISAGEDVSQWKDGIFFYKIQVIDTNGGATSFFRIAESPEKMAAHLAVFANINDENGIGKMKNIQLDNSNNRHYEFISNSGKIIVEKSKYTDVYKYLKDEIGAKKEEIREGLANYYTANPWTAAPTIHAGNNDFAKWDTICAAEVNGKLRLGRDRLAIEEKFGKITRNDIDYDEAIERLERLKKDRNATKILINIISEGINNKLKEKLALWGLNDQESQVNYKLRFREAKEYYDFVSADDKKRYIGASLKEAAKHLGVNKKTLENLTNLTCVDSNGYFISSPSEHKDTYNISLLKVGETLSPASGVRRRQIDSNTLKEVERNRDKWKVPPIYIFKENKTGKIVLSDNEKFSETEGGKTMKKMENVIDISKLLNAHSADTKHHLFDFTGSDPDSNPKKNDSGNSSEDPETDASTLSQYTPTFQIAGSPSPDLPSPPLINVQA